VLEGSVLGGVALVEGAALGAALEGAALEGAAGAAWRMIANAVSWL